MGVWSPDILGSDATVELAMDLLKAAGLGPPKWPPAEMTVSMWPVRGMRAPLIVRHNPDQMGACMSAMDDAIDKYAPLEAKMSTLLKMCNERQTLKERPALLYTVHAPPHRALASLSALR